jgi:nucleotide-binding universal stress UspA family protein
MMNPADRYERIRKILIALDASPASQAALELAADLAARHKAELVGIYVEDINLLRSAELSFTEEVGHFSAISRQVDSHAVENELKAHARRIEEMLSSIAGKANLQWTFRRVRGLIPSELMEAAKETDLIILGKKGWSEGKQIGSTARMVAALAPGQSLILQHKVRPETPVLVVFDGSPDSMNTLKTAGRICSSGSTLTILVPAENESQAREIFSELQGWTEDKDFKIQFRWVNDLNSPRIANLALVTGCEIVILPARSKFINPENLINMVEKADCAVLLVR